MSDLDAAGDPEHVCGDDCLPYVRIVDRDLEDLEESDHIDALYQDLNLVREHAALLVLTLARLEHAGAVTNVRIPARAAAILLDLDENSLDLHLDEDRPHTPADVVDYAIKSAGEDGYVGRAMAALFRLELADDLEEEE